MFVEIVESLDTLSIASFNCLSNNLLVSVKPCLVFPNEFGPDEVMVSLPTFLMRIFASIGISSSSEESSSLNTAATLGFFASFSGCFVACDDEVDDPNLILMPNPPLGFNNGFD